jgi:hypothetical protein
MTPPATANADGRPVARDVALAKLVNQEEDFVGLMSNLQARYSAIGVRYLEKRLIRTGTPQLRRLRLALHQAREPLLEPEPRTTCARSLKS